MMTPEALNHLSDQDIGRYASGGYGAKMRLAFLAGLRDTIKRALRGGAGRNQGDEPTEAA